MPSLYVLDFISKYPKARYVASQPQNHPETQGCIRGTWCARQDVQTCSIVGTPLMPAVNPGKLPLHLPTLSAHWQRGPWDRALSVRPRPLYGFPDRGSGVERPSQRERRLQARWLSRCLRSGLKHVSQEGPKQKYGIVTERVCHLWDNHADLSRDDEKCNEDTGRRVSTSLSIPLVRVHTRCRCSSPRESLKPICFNSSSRRLIAKKGDISWLNWNIFTRLLTNPLQLVHRDFGIHLTGLDQLLLCMQHSGVQISLRIGESARDGKCPRDVRGVHRVLAARVDQDELKVQMS